MTTTQEIVQAAEELGKRIGTHEAAQRFERAMRKLQQNVDAQRALTDLNRFADKIAEKEAQGHPIEVEEKRQLERLRGAVMSNLVLQELQIAQMDYLDFMRKVDEAISGPMAPPEGSPAAPGAPGLSGAAMAPEVM